MTTLNKFVKTIDMRFLTILIVTLCSCLLWAYDNCPPRNLKQKDCLFVVGKNKTHVWNDKIFLTSKTGRDLKSVPVQAETQTETEVEHKHKDVEWAFARTKYLGQRSFLELGIWTTPAGEGDVQTLIWSVYEVQPAEISKLLQKPLQKRKVIEGLSSGGQSVKKVPGKMKYTSDKIFPYGLEIKNQKNSHNKKSHSAESNKLQIHWHVGREKGVL